MFNGITTNPLNTFFYLLFLLLLINFTLISPDIEYLIKMIVFKQFTFDSAHFLPHVPDGHKCKEIHGHTYRLTVFLEGEPDPQLGWVMDFAEISKVIDPIVKEIDHKFLNNIEGLENPTCELMAVWLWKKIKPQVPLLKKIELNETPTSGTIYEG